MRDYSFEEFLADTKAIALKVKLDKPDAIVAVVRGGMTFGHFLAHALDFRDIYTINSVHYEDTKKLDFIKVFNIPNLSNVKKLLIADDISDSGETLLEVQKVLKSRYPDIEIKIATLFWRERSLVKPDFFAQTTDEWIKFLWDFKV